MKLVTCCVSLDFINFVPFFAPEWISFVHPVVVVIAMELLS